MVTFFLNFNIFTYLVCHPVTRMYYKIDVKFFVKHF